MTSVSSRNETPAQQCAATGCDNPIVPASTGRPAHYCSPACRARAHRNHHHSPAPTVAEATMGSATSRGRHPDKAWIVKLRRGNNSIVIAIGLRQRDAHSLAEQINQLLA
jgi:hypothetical protein